MSESLAAERAASLSEIEVQMILVEPITVRAQHRLERATGCFPDPAEKLTAAALPPVVLDGDLAAGREPNAPDIDCASKCVLGQPCTLLAVSAAA